MQTLAKPAMQQESGGTSQPDNNKRTPSAFEDVRDAPEGGRNMRGSLMSAMAGVLTCAVLWGSDLAVANDYAPEHNQHAAYSVQATSSKLAIIMDDMGYSMDRGRRVLRLPGPITVAILPHTPSAAELADATVAAGSEVIVHQPMEPHRHQGSKTARGNLTTDMDRAAFEQTLLASLASVPHSVGVSNHTGSRLTEHNERMSWVMDTLERQGMFFVDSRTTAQTIAFDTAQAYGLPSLSRDVFLDHELTEQALEASFNQAIRLAKLRGHAVLIAHPHELTLRYLERRLPGVVANGKVTLVPASDLVRRARLSPGKSRQAALVQQPDPGSAHTALGH